MFTIGLPSRMPDSLNRGTPLVFARGFHEEPQLTQMHASNWFCTVSRRSHFYVSIDPQILQSNDKTGVGGPPTVTVTNRLPLHRR